MEKKDSDNDSEDLSREIERFKKEQVASSLPK